LEQHFYLGRSFHNFWIVLVFIATNKQTMDPLYIASLYNRQMVSVHRQLAQESDERHVFMYDPTPLVAVTFARPLDITFRFRDGPSTVSFLGFFDEERSGGSRCSLRQLRERMDAYFIILYGMRQFYAPGSLNFRFARAGEGSEIGYDEEEHITVQQYIDSNDRVQVVMYPLAQLAWDE
jgi:hypothetical protein